MSQFDFLAGEESQKDKENQEIEQKSVAELISGQPDKQLNNQPKEPDTETNYDPCPEKPGHVEWNQVLYTAFHCNDSDIFNVFAYLRYEGIAIKKEQKIEQRGRQRSKLTTYSIYQGDVPVERFKAEIVPKYLEPNREGIKKILALAAYNGEFVNLEGLAIKADKEVIADALKKYRGRILAARYENLVHGRRLDDGRMIWVVCEREAGSDNTEITWEEFYVLCETQDRGLLAPGVEGMCKGVKWRE